MGLTGIDLHDVAVPLLAHRGQYCLGDPQGAEEVGLQVRTGQVDGIGRQKIADGRDAVTNLRVASEAPLDFAQHEVKDNPDFREVIEPQNCYICKQDYSIIHHFYDQLCPACAELNFRKRSELADLRGRVALLTGGRVKIGYQAGIKLLRSGARLIVTTRFPRDSAARYAAEPDFEQWSHRLEIFGLDLRHTPSVEAFCHHLMETHDRLDFIVNNACQTVRRPPDFYKHMMEGETAALSSMPEQVRKLLGAYEGVRGYHMLPGSTDAEDGEMLTPKNLPRALAEVAGITHAAELSQGGFRTGESERAWCVCVSRKTYQWRGSNPRSRACEARVLTTRRH